ncbi:MAG: hypothetical protein ACKPKO_48600, partial [Candidatus Fonsibacter sp.]
RSLVLELEVQDPVTLHVEAQDDGGVGHCVEQLRGVVVLPDAHVGSLVLVQHHVVGEVHSLAAARFLSKERSLAFAAAGFVPYC